MEITEEFFPSPPAQIWNEDELVHKYDALQKIDMDWTINEQINPNRTPDVSLTLEKPKDQLSEFEKSMMELIEEGLATKEYVQDMFQQEEIFKESFVKLLKENPNKAIVVCGGKIFVGDSVRELEKLARNEFPNRPPYSYSPSTEF